MQVLIQPYGKSEISLSFLSGFKEPVLNAVRRLPNRRYDPSQRIWIIPDSQECMDSLLQNLYLTGLFTYENVNENQNYPENTNDELINDYVQKETKKLDGYVVSNFPVDAFVLAEELRSQGLNVEFDLTNKKFTIQLEKASKLAKYAFILGEDEILKHQVSIKNLKEGKQITVDRASCLKMIEL